MFRPQMSVRRHLYAILYPYVQMQCNHIVLALLIKNESSADGYQSIAVSLPKCKLAPVSVHLLYFLLLWFNVTR